MFNKFKQKYLFIIFYKINQFIKILLKKYLKKLNYNNFSNIARSNKFFLTFVALVVLFLSYLSIPNIYNKFEIQNELKNQLLNKLNLNFKLTENIRYDFFPRPHFIIIDSSIFENNNEISKIKELKIYVSLNNLFSLKKIKINDVILKNANFNINVQTNDFFLKLLDQNFKDESLTIKDSNIFYKNSENQVLFINKIKNIKYIYDIKDLRNIVISKNEIFNIPYSLELYNNKIKKKIFSKFNVNFLKLQIENEIGYTDNIKKGSADIIINKKKSNATYQLEKNSFAFNFFNKIGFNEFSYKGKINFNPFYSSFVGEIKKINFNSLFNTNALIAQMIKTEILNNKNLDFYLNINANNIKNYENFKNIFLNLKIQDSLIDLDNTKFSWKDYVDFQISDSLLFVEDNELIIDAYLDMTIKNSSQIYKSLLTPKNYRTELKKIELSLSYNFDQKLLKFSNIKINNQIDKDLNKYLKNLIFKDDELQNKIYFKNEMNKAIKVYSG